LIQVRIGCGVTQHTAHRDNLPLVVEGMRQDVMEHERRRAHSEITVGEMKFSVCI
jgi:hypothetical protein